ncbi:unnamed protein product [Peronospora belbahrii]|uniref:E3 ubiquitin ligase complex SCF subunit n=1 Tax=Peronospora belbahrii TaxID=622444 RepID=A0AAU9KIS7_9STRA|nr:unnamed protein product [Peronospora belbahrii]CAH0514171.1 unnamed protein product [Peronospora belbahrii]
MTSTIKLVSMDGDAFEVETKAAILSQLVQSLVENEQENDGIQVIPLPNVTTPVLAKVMEFCRHYEDSPMTEIQKPLKSNNIRDLVDGWYDKFIHVSDPKLLFDLILAANYMDIKALLDLSCAKVVCILKTKSPEEVRATFRITEEFTEEEKQQIAEEYKWYEDI